MQFLVYGISPLEEAAPPTPEMYMKLGQLTEDTKKAGILVATGALAGTSKRLKSTGTQFSVTDGPYVEAKELMGGFAVLELSSEEEAIEWSKRFRSIVGDGESEIVRI